VKLCANAKAEERVIPRVMNRVTINADLSLRMDILRMLKRNNVTLRDCRLGAVRATKMS
jgi:hypothetical protein